VALGIVSNPPLIKQLHPAQRQIRFINHLGVARDEKTPQSVSDRQNVPINRDYLIGGGGICESARIG